MKKRVATWMIAAVVVAALANADIYPFMPFGLFGVVGLIGAGLWLWKDSIPTGQKQPRPALWRYIVGSILACLVLPICMKMAIKVHVTAVIENRLLWNCSILGVTAMLAVLNLTDRQANTASHPIAAKRGSG